MKVFYLGVDVSKKKLDLCLRSNGKDILYDVIPNDLSSIKSWLTRTFEKFFLSEDSLVVCAEHTGQYTQPDEKQQEEQKELIPAVNTNDGSSNVVVNDVSDVVEAVIRSE